MIWSQAEFGRVIVLESAAPGVSSDLEQRSCSHMLRRKCGSAVAKGRMVIFLMFRTISSMKGFALAWLKGHEMASALVGNLDESIAGHILDTLCRSVGI